MARRIATSDNDDLSGPPIGVEQQKLPRTARRRARQLMRTGQPRPGGGIRVRALDIDHFIVDIRVNDARRAIGLVLDREPPELDKESLHAFLDDFTTADLHGADLAGIDLGGVRWSEHGTRWPAAVGVEDLKSRSEETAARSGIWVVRSGTATVPDFATLG